VRESAPLVQNRLQAHPEVTGDDLTRIREVSKWRSTKIGPRRPQPKVEVPVSAWHRPANARLAA